MPRVTVEVADGPDPETDGFLVGKRKLAQQEAIAMIERSNTVGTMAAAYACGVIDTIRWLRNEQESPFDA